MKDGSPSVSVVIPTFNRPGMLAQAVESVLAQTVQPRDILVVDNGDTHEEIAALIGRYGGKVRCVAEPTPGVQAARNRGFAETDGAWVATLDDDDLYRPDFLERMLPAIEDERADIIFCDHRKFRDGRQHDWTNFSNAPPGFWDNIAGADGDALWSFVGGFPAERLTRYIPFYPSQMIVRRRLFDRIGGYDTRVRGIKSEDIAFLARALSSGELAIVWDDLVDYRIHGANTSINHARQKIGRWQIFEFLSAHRDALSAALIAELERDLPMRRREIFDFAFSKGEYWALPLVERHLQRADMTPARRLKRLMVHAPRPLIARLQAEWRRFRPAPAGPTLPRRIRPHSIRPLDLHAAEQAGEGIRSP